MLMIPVINTKYSQNVFKKIFSSEEGDDVIQGFNENGIAAATENTSYIIINNKYIINLINQ